jgi:hypothetical protein
MSSVPLGIWPDNLSSLAVVGVLFFIFIANIISHEKAAIGIMIMLGIFVVDQLLLGPLWWMRHR